MFSLMLVIFAACANDRGELSRQEEVAQRGDTVMPFDLERTTHVFVPLDDGGRQRVIVDEPSDERQVSLVRRHLREEAKAFASGDFSDPAEIHGHAMPGLRELEAAYRRIEVAYSTIPAGAQIRYRSSDASVVSALHRWFDAQLMDHGMHAEGPRSESPEG